MGEHEGDATLVGGELLHKVSLNVLACMVVDAIMGTLPVNS